MNWLTIGIDMEETKEVKKNDKGFEIVEDNFRLVAFNRWGYQCFDCKYPNKTKAINEGRTLKRNDYAFSYKVYGQAYINEDGKKMRPIIQRG